MTHAPAISIGRNDHLFNIESIGGRQSGGAKNSLRLLGQCTPLFELDVSILELRQSGGDSPAAVRRTGRYHNLPRMWAQS